MKDITVQSDISIRQAMKILDKTAEKCLLIVNEKYKLLGTLTDGDLRRSILSGAQFSESIIASYCKDPTVLVRGRYSSENAKNLILDKKIDLIPVLDHSGVLVDYITWETLGKLKKQSNELKNVQVVIMAGGMGTRLEPFTKVLPKPLVPINEKPVIEHIIERFTAVGCSHFYLTVNYKGRLLKAYFEELQPNYIVNFVEEQEPLGTVGSLRLLKGKFKHPFFITNCDIIIKADFTRLYEFHQKGGYDLTLLASAKEFIIPYGTCELNQDGHLSHINEKPSYELLINTGLYVINPDLLGLIPEKKFYHITHLIEKAKDIGMKVGVFPIDEDSWIDVGQWAEYRKAVELL